MVRLVAIGLALLVVSCRPSPPPADPLDVATRAMRQGDLAQALSVLAEDGARLVDPGARDSARLLEAEVRLMRRELDAAASLLAAPLADSPARARLELRREYLRGYEANIRGQFDLALKTLTSVSARAGDAGAPDVVLQAEPLLSQVLYRLGRTDEANARLEAAIARAGVTPDEYDDATLLVTAGMGRLTRDRFDEALGYFERVLAFDALSDDMVYATALSNAGICYARLGEFDKAIAVQTRAVAAHDKRQIPIYIEQSQGELGNTYALMERPAQALPFLQRAHRVAEEAGRARDAALWLDNQASAEIELGHWDLAERLNQQAILLKERSGDTSLIYNALRRARISAGRGAYDRAIAEFEATLAEAGAAPYVRWQAHGYLAETLMAAGQPERGLKEFESAVRLIDMARTDLKRVEHRFAFLSALIGFHRAYVEALVRLGSDERALEVADLSRARVLSENTGQGMATRLSAAAFRRRAALTGATLVTYWLAPGRSHVWVITGTSIRRLDLPPSSEIEALVAQHRAFVERSIADPLAGATSPGDMLAAAVLEPVRTRIPKGARVLLVPDGALHAVNFETLPVGSPRHFWIEDVTLTVAPSLGLGGTTAARRIHAPTSLLVMGDAVSASADQPPLRFAAAEIADVARHFPARQTTILRGTAAEPTAYAGSQPNRFNTIHFAAHATANAGSPLESTIELSRGPSGQSKLYARDIVSTPISADLVTISACRGVGERSYGGEGPVGLAWAFLRAGARRVVAGLWDVDDEASAALMADFYAGVAKGLDPATALRASKLALIGRGGSLRKPFYWGALQIIEAGRAE